MREAISNQSYPSGTERVISATEFNSSSPAHTTEVVSIFPGVRSAMRREF